MSSREVIRLAQPWPEKAVLCLIFLLLPFALPAQDWEGFAAASSSAQDSVLLTAMTEGDLSTALSICRGVSRRADPSLNEFIQALTASHTGSGSWRSELLLRVLLQPAGDGESSDDFRRARVAANGNALSALFARMNEWTDAQLAGVLVRIAPLAASPEGLLAVIAVGNRIMDGLRKGNGFIPSQEAGLALDYLKSAVTLGRQELAEQCTAIARLSREAVIVKAARVAAQALLSLPSR